MLRATTRIEFGFVKDKTNSLIIIEAGQSVKKLPEEEIKALIACGAVVDDGAPDAAAATDAKG